MRNIVVALSLFVALALPGSLLAHEGHKHKEMGTVVAVDASHVEIETKDAKKVSVLVNKETKYLRGKTLVTAKDIKVGERIVVTVVEKEGKKIASEILLAPTDEKSAPEEKDPEKD